MTADKVTTPEEAVAGIPDGATIALGGVHSHNGPTALVHALIRRGVRDLELIPTPSAGAPVDMLIAAGCVRRLHVSYVGLEFLGLAPNFRRAAENQTIEIVEGDEAYIVYGFRAGASRLPFLPLPPLYEGTDLPKVNPRIRTTTDPYTGRTVTTIPALRADYGLFHAQVTDRKGNAQIFGQRRFEDVMAKACDHVVISSDEILDEYAPAPDPRLVSIPGAIVDKVAHAPYGAHPLSSPGHYAYDRDLLVEYRDLAAQDRTKEYLETYVHSVADHQEYLEKVGVRRLLGLRQTFR
ncbi:CoA transferase subunit A [Sphaerisporangium aureirubrum]|uniref:CoA transferase subunit A n=1 Tax=Sphaerisporangium aureirubrum TaxID=1544736 RepID=A0ABW1NUG9_9ACTN